MIAALAKGLAGLALALALALAGVGATLPVATGTHTTACRADSDCGYDPASDACDSDPRSNKQPPLRDQGLLCYCEEAFSQCAILRVPPVPCEGDASCAVSLAPRPHPVAADSAHPHEKGRVCRDFTIATTCERTNICTMNAHDCPDAGAGPRR